MSGLESIKKYLKNTDTRYSRLVVESGEEDFDQEAWDRAGVKAKELVAKLYEELNHPFQPSNYDPNNPADRAAWERAGVKAKKCMEEICWSGPYSRLANMQSGSAGENPAAETSSRASGTS